MDGAEARESVPRLGPGKFLILFVLVLVLGTWGFANASGSHGFFDDLYQAVRLIPLHSGAEAKPVTLPLQIARYLAILADAAVLAAFGSVLLFGRDVPNRLRLRRSSDHAIVCGAGVHGSRMVAELSTRNKVVVVDLEKGSPGMREPSGGRAAYVVDDAVRRSTLRRAGIRKASRLIAVTGDDFVNSQIVSTVQALALDADTNRELEVFVQIEDPSLARSLEDGQRPDHAHMPRVHVFTPNALVAAALFGEGPRGPSGGQRNRSLAVVEDQEQPHLLLAGDHPLLEAVVLAALRRRRAHIERSGPDQPGVPVRVSLLGPDAVGRIERLIESWSPEPEALELEAYDVALNDEHLILSSRWLRDRRILGHALVACNDELVSIELTVTLSRVLDHAVPLTRVTGQPESELDRQLRSRTRHRVCAIADLAWGSDGTGVDWISAANRLTSALRRENVSDPEARACKLLHDTDLGVHSDSAPRISPGSRPIAEALLETIDPKATRDGTIPISALIDAGVTINLASTETLRRAAERLSSNGVARTHDAFAAWCEYVRHSSHEEIARDPAPTDPIGASVVGLTLAARGIAQLPDLVQAEPVARRASRIAIFAGGSRSMSDETSRVVKQLLTRTFRHYDGLILTGGTMVGLPGAVRAAAQENNLRIIGYAPAGKGDAGPGVTLRETRSGAGAEFSEKEPLAMWADILASGFKDSDVRVVAFPGGEITRSEVVLARALGAKVVWLDPCSESEMALEDELPLGADGVLELPSDPMTLRAFLAWPLEMPSGWPTESIARYLHNDYREKHREIKPTGDPALAPWERLLPALQRSNLAAAADIPNKLQILGKRPVKDGRRLRLGAHHIELLAELEHGRYNYERLSAGWELGQRQVLRLVNPHLRPWDDLTDTVKEWDRDSVTNIDPALAQIGWGVEDI